MLPLKQILTGILGILLVSSGCRTSAVSTEWIGTAAKDTIINNETKPYIELKNGEKQFVNEIKYYDGFGSLKADGKKYDFTEVKAFMIDPLNYFISYKKQFVRQIIAGSRINIYTIVRGRTDLKGNSYSSIYYLYRKDGGGFKNMYNVKDMSSLVADCPKASEMLSGSYLTVYNRLKKHTLLVHEAFKIYNDGCK